MFLNEYKQCNCQKSTKLENDSNVMEIEKEMIMILNKIMNEIKIEDLEKLRLFISSNYDTIKNYFIIDFCKISEQFNLMEILLGLLNNNFKNEIIMEILTWIFSFKNINYYFKKYLNVDLFNLIMNIFKNVDIHNELLITKCLDLLNNICYTSYELRTYALENESFEIPWSAWGHNSPSKSK